MAAESKWYHQPRGGTGNCDGFESVCVVVVVVVVVAISGCACLDGS